MAMAITELHDHGNNRIMRPHDQSEDGKLLLFLVITESCYMSMRIMESCNLAL